MESNASDGTSSPLVVVLAAGAGSRFAGEHHKLLGLVDGRPIVQRAIDAAIGAAIGPIVVVTGAADLSSTIDAVEREHPAAPLRVIHNADWSSGQATSLAVVIRAAAEGGHDAIVVGLADQPFVEPSAWRAVAASDACIAVATYEGRRGNPVRLSKRMWPLLPTTGDTGARGVIRLRPDLVQEIPCDGSAADIDTLEDLRVWQNRSSTNSP